MFKFVLIAQSVALVLMPFVASADYAFDTALSQIATQIKVFQDRIAALIAELAPKGKPVAVVPSLAPTAPTFDLQVNGSDGPITIKKGESTTFSWNLSDHNWSYCTKLGGWSGGVKPVSGSEMITNLPYGQTYILYCYIGSTRYSDSVVVNVVLEETKVETKLEPTPSAVVSSTCSLSVSKPSVTVGKDAIEATWVVKSDPPGWPFYWHGTDNGKEVPHYYGGATDAIIVTPYNNTPAIYARYFEVVQGTGFVVQDSNHPKPTCTSNAVTFEIKMLSSKGNDIRNSFLANISLARLVRWVSR